MVHIWWKYRKKVRMRAKQFSNVQRWRWFLCSCHVSVNFVSIYVKMLKVSNCFMNIHIFLMKLLYYNSSLLHFQFIDNLLCIVYWLINHWEKIEHCFQQNPHVFFITKIWHFIKIRIMIQNNNDTTFDKCRLDMFFLALGGHYYT